MLPLCRYGSNRSCATGAIAAILLTFSGIPAPLRAGETESRSNM